MGLFARPRLYAKDTRDIDLPDGLLENLASRLGLRSDNYHTGYFGSPAWERDFQLRLAGPGPSTDGRLIRRYGRCVGHGFNRITAVGDAHLTDLLGSTHELWYTKEDTFRDWPFAAVWLVNERNWWKVEQVLVKDPEGLILVSTLFLEQWPSGLCIDLKGLRLKPWSTELIRQAGIDIPG